MASPVLDKLKALNGYFVQTAHLMVGVPSYQTYLDHMKTTHGDAMPVMNYEEFFRERQAARFGEVNTSHAAPERRGFSLVRCHTLTK